MIFFHLAINCHGYSPYAIFEGLDECKGLSKIDSTVTVEPVARVDNDEHSTNQHILFMAMAFKSVSHYCVVDHVML